MYCMYKSLHKKTFSWYYCKIDSCCFLKTLARGGGANSFLHAPKCIPSAMLIYCDYYICNENPLWSSQGCGSVFRKGLGPDPYFIPVWTSTVKIHLILTFLATFIGPSYNIYKIGLGFSHYRIGLGFSRVSDPDQVQPDPHTWPPSEGQGSKWSRTLLSDIEIIGDKKKKIWIIEKC